MEEELIKRVAETPARAYQGVADAIDFIPKQKPVRIAKKYWGTLGPGLTTGASGDDPSGIAAYSQIGAQFGLKYLWLAPYTVVPMIIVQEMCARIAHVTGKGIAGNIKHHYPKPILTSAVFLLLIANIISIAADIAGMSAAAQLLFPNLSFPVIAFGFTIVSLILQIRLTYTKYANFLKYLTLVLLSYIVTAFFVTIDWREVAFSTLIPTISFDKNTIFMITAVLGATISPYLLFWQASQELEASKPKTNAIPSIQAGMLTKQIKTMRKDVTSGMIFSNLIMFFIIAVTGTVLYSQGIEIHSAADAAAALRPIAGDYAYILFALGVIGTGMLAMPVLAGSASYAFAEAFSFSQGLDKTVKQASAFYGVIIIAMFVGLGINLVGIDPIQALIFAGVINGLITPVLVTLILLVANNAKIMGPWKNGPWSNGLGWTIAILMYLAGTATIIGLFL